MLKIMLADADADNLRNFKTYIRLAFPDARIVGSAATAANFISHVKEWNPNLIIADIRFFGTSALQTIRDTHEFFPDKRFIIYGTYNDAEYMEKAIEYGVIDYIYRPVKPSELEKSLNRAIKTFEDMSRRQSEREQLVGKYKDNLSMFRDRFLTNLTGGHLTDEQEIRRGFAYFNIDLKPGFSVFTLRIDHFKKIILTLDEMEKNVLVYRILLIVNDGLKRIKNGVAVVNRLNAISVLLGGFMPLFDTVEFCEELRTDILHQTKINVTTGLGRIYGDARDIAVSYRESEAALRYRHYMGYNTVIPIHFVEPQNHITYRYPQEKEERLVYSAVTGEYESCRALLGQIIAALRLCEPLPDRFIPKIIMDILFSINRFASEQQMRIEDSFNTYFPSKDVLNLRNLDDAFVYMDNALKSFCAHVLALKEGVNAELVAKVTAYIDAHYAENISLARLAAHAETTPEFLSTVFQKSTGQSVYQYAVAVRVRNAAGMLMTSLLPPEEIAHAVGYDDYKHFNAVFRQHMGLGMEEYRRR